jgi:hypothetical protein
MSPRIDTAGKPARYAKNRNMGPYHGNPEFQILNPEP